MKPPSTIESKYGVVSCTIVNGRVTRSVSNVCVGINHDYHKVGEVWVSGDTEYTCKVANGEFHAAASGNLSESVLCR